MLRLCAGAALQPLRASSTLRPLRSAAPVGSRWLRLCAPAPSAARAVRSPLLRVRGFSSAGGDYYATLGVGRGATADEIKRAYFRVAKKTHPDVDHSPGAAARFRAAAEAFEVLRNPARRRAYDAGGMAGAQQQQQRQQQQQQSHDYARQQQQQGHAGQQHGGGAGAWEREQMRNAEDVFKRVWAELGFDEIDAYIAQARPDHGPIPARARGPPASARQVQHELKHAANAAMGQDGRPADFGLARAFASEHRALLLGVVIPAAILLRVPSAVRIGTPSPYRPPLPCPLPRPTRRSSRRACSLSGSSRSRWCSRG